MHSFSQFARRYHQVKSSMEDLAELRFAKARKLAEIELAKMKQVLEEKQQAMFMRGQQRSAVEWQAWELYIQALEAQLQEISGRWEIARDHAEEERMHLQEAHRDEKRWQTIVTQHSEQQYVKMQQLLQKTADEGAVIRFGRSV